MIIAPCDPDSEEENGEIILGEGWSVGLEDFEMSQDVEHIKLERAVEYCCEGNVVFLSIKNGTGRAFVRGTKWYAVEFDFDGETVSNLYCDCPFNDSTLCKHELAMLITLRVITNLPQLENKKDFTAIDKTYFLQEFLSDNSTGLSCTRKDNQAVITLCEHYAGQDCGFNVVTIISMFPDGRVFLDHKAGTAGVSVLPRIGASMRLEASYGHGHYYGDGPCDTYPDRCAAGESGYYSFDVRHQQDYVRPQEYGSHMNTRYMTLTDGTHSLTVTGAIPYAMSALPQSTETLFTAEHSDELPASDGTLLHVDYAQHGLDNRSCGPEVLPKWQLRTTCVQFVYLLQSGDYTGTAYPQYAAGLFKPWKGTQAAAQEAYRDPSDPDQRRKIGL